MSGSPLSSKREYSRRLSNCMAEKPRVLEWTNDSVESWTITEGGMWVESPKYPGSTLLSRCRSIAGDDKLR